MLRQVRGARSGARPGSICPQPYLRSVNAMLGNAWLRFCAGPAAAHGSILLPPTALAPAAPDAEPVDPVERLSAACLKQGRLHVEKGRLPEALAWFDRALALQPDLGIAKFCRAMVLADLGRPDEAAVSLEGSLGRTADDAPARIQTARLMARHGQYDAALRVLGPALHLKPHLASRILADGDFRALRDHPHFLALVGALPADPVA